MLSCKSVLWLPGFVPFVCARAHTHSHTDTHIERLQYRAGFILDAVGSSKKTNISNLDKKRNNNLFIKLKKSIREL